MTTVEAMNKRLGTSLREVDYDEWLEPTGEGDYDAFDNAAKQLLGKRAYDAADIAARLAAAVDYKLGLTKQYRGGVDLERLINV